MKAHSPLFARIRADVIAIVRVVPRGELVSFADIARHLDVVPRHVAYILAKLGPADEEAVPWYRAVSADGWLKTTKIDHAGRTQAASLEAEGITVDEEMRIMNIAAHLRSVGDLPHGVCQQQRPASAPRCAVA